MPYITSIERLASEQGEQRGLIAGKIQMLQRFLSDVVESSEALLSQSTEELDGKLEALQQRFDAPESPNDRL